STKGPAGEAEPSPYPTLRWSKTNAPSPAKATSEHGGGFGGSAPQHHSERQGPRSPRTGVPSAERAGFEPAWACALPGWAGSRSATTGTSPGFFFVLLTAWHQVLTGR